MVNAHLMAQARHKLKIGEKEMISADKIRYNIGEYLWNFWQNCHDIESIRKAEKTLRSEIEMFSVFLEYESEYYTLTLYYQHMELVSITFDDGLKDPYKKYMVYVNWPYYENGEHGFVVRKEESDKQHVFLETNSAKVAFNMVNRIVANMRYPKAKKIW